MHLALIAVGFSSLQKVQAYCTSFKLKTKIQYPFACILMIICLVGLSTLESSVPVLKGPLVLKVVFKAKGKGVKVANKG